MAQSEAVPDTRLVLPAALTRRHHKPWRFWLLGAAAATAALAAAVFVPRGTKVEYRSAPVVRRTVVRVVEAPGRVDVTTRVNVPAPAEGILEQIFVKAGASVEQGQPLLQLDVRQAHLALTKATSSVRISTGRLGEAHAALEAAQDVRERTERLAARGLASDGELSKTRAEEAKAAAAEQAARATLVASRESASAAEFEQRSLTVHSPIRGLVLRAPEWAGEVVSPEKGPLVVIGSDPTVLRVEASVAEADVGLVRIGQRAEFTVPAFPERTFHGRVEDRATEPENSGAATSYAATLSADNADGALLPGMTATLRIEVARAENVLAVREAALRFAPLDATEAPSRTRVFRIGENGRITPIDVAAGVSDAAYTEIKPRDPGTLDQGDLVAIGFMPTEQHEGSGGPGITFGRRP